MPSFSSLFKNLPAAYTDAASPHEVGWNAPQITATYWRAGLPFLLWISFSAVAYVQLAISEVPNHLKPRRRSLRTVPRHRQVGQSSSSRRQTSRLAGLHRRWNSTAHTAINECRTIVMKSLLSCASPNRYYVTTLCEGGCCLPSTLTHRSFSYHSTQFSYRSQTPESP